MQPLPTAIYNTSQILALEQAVMSSQNISAYTLMQRAAACAYAELIKTWPKAINIIVICGAGNNAGDGYELARLLEQGGKSVQIYFLTTPSQLQGAALEAFNACQQAGITIAPYQPATTLVSDVLVDAILGTGLKREVTGLMRHAIAAMNATNTPILALDIPSGLAADTGDVLGIAIKANKTITFIGLKCGLFLGQARGYRGELVFADLDIPEQLFAAQAPTIESLHLASMQSYIAPRAWDTHKGDCGHVLIIGGDYGMQGAARMAGEAAARVGAGLVSIATREHLAGLISAMCPELMSHGIESAAALKPLLERASVCVLGPGLGVGDWGKELFSEILTTDLPLVVDADGLNILAQQNTISRNNWILTPHPGEAGRLLQIDVTAVQSNRIAASKQLQQQYAGVCILKGAGTLICASNGDLSVVDYGNPGMASGGMGDILSGVIGGLLAQGQTVDIAAKVGATIHSYAGDCAARDGERGLLATDLMSHLRRLVNP